MKFNDYVNEVATVLKKRFELSFDEIVQVIDYYANDIDDAFFGYNECIDPNSLIDSLLINGKLKWKK